LAGLGVASAMAVWLDAGSRVARGSPGRGCAPHADEALERAILAKALKYAAARHATRDTGEHAYGWEHSGMNRSVRSAFCGASASGEASSPSGSDFAGFR
jgi:hypothetical protein